MKILVFSDTHGETEAMYDIISRSRSSCELVIHLGDSFKDIYTVRRDFPQIAFLGVRGNCDYYEDKMYPLNHTFTVEGCRFYIVHGHMQRVNDGFSLLTAEAKRAGAGYALFGHTHVGLIKEHNGVTIFNPGSLERPRDYTGGSYGIINASNGKCTFEIITL